MSTPPPEFFVAKDTREQKGHGWTFPPDRRGCLGTVVRKLDTADYAVAGLEDKCLIERKGSPAEFAANLFEARFGRELDRLDAVPHAFVFLEFDLADLTTFPVNSGIPEEDWPDLKMTPALFQRRLWEAATAHPTVSFQFVGRHGQAAALSLFKRIAERYGG